MQRFKKDVGNVVARRGSLSSCLEGSLVLSQPLVGPDGQSRFQMQCQQNSSRSTSGSSRLSAILNAAKATLASGPVSPQMHESPTSAAAVESPPAANEASSPDIGSSSAFNNSEPSFMALLSESNMERSWSKGQPALHMNLLDANLIQPYYFSYPLNLQHQTQAFVFPQEPMPPYSFHHPNPTPSQHHGLNIPPAMSLEAAYIFQNQRAVSSGPSSNLFPTPPRELTAYGLNNSTDISLNFIGSEFDSTTSSTSRVPNHTTHSEFFEMTRDSWFVS
ncbi:hypothetical protein BC830DRAFT_695720 [Chytriomyces sp. MP71]|nr:hypothetical protein BC830DRAFT_695720 [Chytriomyces sp. MP71]